MPTQLLLNAGNLEVLGHLQQAYENLPDSGYLQHMESGETDGIEIYAAIVSKCRACWHSIANTA